GRDDIGVEREAGAGAAGIGLLFHQDRRIAAVNARAAVFLRHGGAEEARFARLAPDLARHDAFLFPFLVIGDDLALEELARRLAEHLVVIVIDAARDAVFGHSLVSSTRLKGSRALRGVTVRNWRPSASSCFRRRPESWPVAPPCRAACAP